MNKTLKNIATGAFLALGLSAQFAAEADASPRKSSASHHSPHHNSGTGAGRTSQRGKKHGVSARGRGKNAIAASGACRPDQLRLRQRVDVVMDAKTGQVLFGNNENTPFFEASMSKRMTLLLTLEALKNGTITKNTLIDLPSQGYEPKDPVPFTVEKMSVGDVVIAMNTRSSNRAPVALARAIAGNDESFVAMMNAKAAAIGMTRTHYVNPVGYPTAAAQRDHYTTAVDQAHLEKYLMDHFPDELAALRITKATVTGYRGGGKIELVDLKTTVHLMPGETADGEESPLAIPGLLGAKTGTACALGSGMSGEMGVDLPAEGLNFTAQDYERRTIIFVTGGHAHGGTRDAFLHDLLTSAQAPWLPKLVQVRLDETRVALSAQWQKVTALYGQTAQIPADLSGIGRLVFKSLPNPLPSAPSSRINLLPYIRPEDIEGVFHLAPIAQSSLTLSPK